MFQIDFQLKTDSCVDVRILFKIGEKRKSWQRLRVVTNSKIPSGIKMWIIKQ